MLLLNFTPNTTTEGILSHAAAFIQDYISPVRTQAGGITILLHKAHPVPTETKTLKK